MAIDRTRTASPNRPPYGGVDEPVARVLAKEDAAVAEANARRAAAEPLRRFTSTELPYLSRRVQTVIRLAAYGDFDTIAQPMSIEAACRIVGMQLRAARRLQSSPLFMEALSLAKTERAMLEHPQEAHRAPPAPIPPVAAPIAPPSAPKAATARPEAAPQVAERSAVLEADPTPLPVAPSAREDADRVIYTGRHPDPERYADLVRVAEPVAPLEDPPAPEPIIRRPTFDTFDMSPFVMRPSPGVDANRPPQSPRSIARVPRRSLRRS